MKSTLNIIPIFPVVQAEMFEVLHACPFKEEILNDHESLCNCDDEATVQCARDI
jgi:hypothetical protein